MKRAHLNGESPATFRRLGRDVLFAVPVGVLAGSASALFLWSLDRVTDARWQNPWLLWLLPVFGFAVGWIYHRIGHGAAHGTNLILDEIHAPGGGVPARMAPLVLFGTLATHLGGGSGGREGTAVQMGEVWPMPLPNSADWTRRPDARCSFPASPPDSARSSARLWPARCSPSKCSWSGVWPIAISSPRSSRVSSAT